MGGAWTVHQFKGEGGGGWQEREVGVFVGGVDTPMHIMPLPWRLLINFMVDSNFMSNIG